MTVYIQSERKIPENFYSKTCKPIKAGDTLESLIDAYLYNLYCIRTKDDRLLIIEKWDKEEEKE